jgi:type IV secretory pathway VirB2 component (pilin)
MVAEGWDMIAKFRQLGVTCATVMFAGAAHAQQAYADPEGSGAIVGALHWIQGALLGAVATVIAVAFVGFMMLTGRMNWRHGAAVILGLGPQLIFSTYPRLPFPPHKFDSSLS